MSWRNVPPESASGTTDRDVDKKGRVLTGRVGVPIEGVQGKSRSPDDLNLSNAILDHVQVAPRRKPRRDC